MPARDDEDDAVVDVSGPVAVHDGERERDMPAVAPREVCDLGNDFVLGMFAHGRRTGYDIKRAVETSTRFFWGAS